MKTHESIKLTGKAIIQKRKKKEANDTTTEIHQTTMKNTKRRREQRIYKTTRKPLTVTGTKPITLIIT